MRRERMGAILVAISTLGTGSISVFAKLAYSAGANTLTVLTIRFLLAAAILWLICLYRRVQVNIGGKRILFLLLLGSVCFGGMAFLFFLSLNYLSAPVVSLLFYTYPTIVFLIGLLFTKEKFRVGKSISLLFSFSGTALVLGEGGNSLDLRGITLVLISAGLYALYIVLSNHFFGDVPPLVATTYTISGVVVFNSVWGIASGGLTWVLSPLAWFSIVSLALFSTIFTLIVFLEGLKTVGATNTAVICTIEPIFTMILAVMVLGEWLSLKQLFGGLIIISGLLILNLSERKNQTIMEIGA